ncbi:MAG TPA: ROK family protein [Pirellulaceae bacterium]|nr:ROK family protein [Pirellulaceae bacterium]
MILAVEIGGTKLQVALVEPESGRIVERRRDEVVAADGAAGILHRIERMIDSLPSGSFDRVGVGFGGPVGASGRIYRSHQIDGWDGFELGLWCSDRTGRPSVVANDCDAAALGEALWGAGRGYRSTFYMTVGTGVGGGWIVDGRRQGVGRPSIAEVGHLRPGLACTSSYATVESLASGAGIAARARATAAVWFGRATPDERPIVPPVPEPTIGRVEFETARSWWDSFPADLPPDARRIGRAAADGNPLARAVLEQATTVLGWALAQVATLLSPECLVIGGGVSQLPDPVFRDPIVEAFRCYAFGPVRDETAILPSALGEDVVLIGAAAVATES